MSARLPYVATGIANTASVIAAFTRIGRELVPVADADEVRDADALVLPGVGHFDAAVRRLRDDGLFEALQQRLAQGRPTIGICLGMQLTAEGSDEAPGVAGLGWLPGACTRFAAGVRTPQMGWNLVEAPRDARVLRTGHAYFANSYALRTRPDDPDMRVATADHGGEFVAAVERGPVVLCQFHPELSGAFGGALLRRWLDVVDNPNEVLPC